MNFCYFRPLALASRSARSYESSFHRFDFSGALCKTNVRMSDSRLITRSIVDLAALISSKEVITC